MSRSLEIIAFIDRHGWGTAEVAPFAADFSPRRYARLTKADGTTAILMDADANQKTTIFVALARILHDCGIQAPEIFAAEPQDGLVLLQDFGTRNVGALIDAGENPKTHLLKAIEILAVLHKKFDPIRVTHLHLPRYTPAFFVAQMEEMFLDAYFPFTTRRDATKEEREEFRAAWLSALRQIEELPQSLLLRDFMSDNLMDLPNGLGVLDFQDSGIGCIAYDIASLCEVVRRDGMFELLPDCINHYIQKSDTNIPANDLARTCIILSAQRHTRILGIIANLAIKQGRRDKLIYLPRVRQHLSMLLQNPGLMPVRMWFEENSLI